MQTSSGYNINVGVVINKNTKTAALQSLNKLIAEAEKNGSIQLKVDSKNALKQYQTIKTASGDYAKVLTELDKSHKIIHQRIIEVGKDLQKAEQYTKKQTKALEEQTTALDKLNKKEQQRQAELNKILSNAQVIDSAGTFNDEIDGINKVVRTYKTLDNAYIETASYYDKMTGKRHESITSIMTEAEYTEKMYKKQQSQIKENEALREKEEKSLQRQVEAEKRAQQQAEKHAQAQSRLGQETKKNIGIFDDFTNTFMKMVKFNTINLIYDAIIDSMRQAIEVVNDFDKALTEFKKVTDTSQLSLKDYINTLSELGSEVGRSATQLLEASTEFAKSGFNAEDSAKLAQIASIYQNVADAELSAGESASYVISQMKAFGYTVDEAIQIIDKTNEVKLLLTSINCVNFWKAKIFI